MANGFLLIFIYASMSLFLALISNKTVVYGTSFDLGVPSISKATTPYSYNLFLTII
jgi:hypothetical protein